jgi:hypothetical protein
VTSDRLPDRGPVVCGIDDRSDGPIGPRYGPPFSPVDGGHQSPKSRLIGLPLRPRPSHIVEFGDSVRGKAEIPPVGAGNHDGCRGELGDRDMVGMTVCAIGPECDHDLGLQPSDLESDPVDDFFRRHPIEIAVDVVQQHHFPNPEDPGGRTQFTFPHPTHVFEARTLGEIPVPSPLPPGGRDHEGVNALGGIPGQRAPHSQRFIVRMGQHTHQPKSVRHDPLSSDALVRNGCRARVYNGTCVKCSGRCSSERQCPKRPGSTTWCSACLCGASSPTVPPGGSLRRHNDRHRPQRARRITTW